MVETTYRLASSPGVYTPGLIDWAINSYGFERDRARLLDVIVATFPSVTPRAIEQLLSKSVPYTVEGETLIFAVEE